MKYILNVNLYFSRSGVLTDDKDASYGNATYRKGMLIDSDNTSWSKQEIKTWFSPYKKAPKPPKLYNVELHQWNKETKTSCHLSTEMWNSPRSLCKWYKKCLEDRSMTQLRHFAYTVNKQNPMDNPKLGYYYKIVRADKK